MYFDHLFGHFVSDDNLRPHFCVPNEQDGYVYATDGHQVIRIPTSLIKGEYPNQYSKKISGIWPNPKRMKFSTVLINPHSLQKAILSIPKIMVNETVDCPNCKGEGVITCDACGHANECNKCDGDGLVSTGEKKQVIDDHYTICLEGTTHIKPRFLINLLHCAEATQQPIYHVTVCDNKMQLFTTGEIEVGIMPISIYQENIFAIHLTSEES